MNSKMKILIVDDCEMNRLLLKVICKNIDEFEIEEAVDGQDAVEKCDKLQPHIILMDIMMPRLDGFQASKQIIERYPDTIIIGVTTMSESDIEQKITAAGMVSYIRKPINKEILCKKLKSHAEILQ